MAAAVNPLARKLLLKPGVSALVLNAPQGYLSQLEPLPEGASVVTAGQGQFAFVQLFIKDSGELASLGQQAFSAARPDGLLWLCYPKGTSKLKTDVNRDILNRRLAEEHGLEGVAMVSIDDTWSAMRFKPKGGSPRR
jgi:hypothetical protein